MSNAGETRTAVVEIDVTETDALTNQDANLTNNAEEVVFVKIHFVFEWNVIRMPTV